MAQYPLSSEPLETLPTGELLEQTLAEARELARLEIRLAQAELHEDLRRLKWAGVLLALAGAMFIVALSMFDVALVLALGGTANAALIVAFLVLAEVLVLAYFGARQLRHAPLERTRARLTSDVRELKEHLK